MNRPRPIRVAVLCALLVAVPLLSGCAKRQRIQFESNTCYFAVLDRQSTGIIQDCGNSSYRVAGQIDCVEVTLQSDTGYVRVRIDEGPWAIANTPRGTVKVCR